SRHLRQAMVGRDGDAEDGGPAVRVRVPRGQLRPREHPERGTRRRTDSRRFERAMTIRTAVAAFAVAITVPALAHAQTRSADKAFVAGGKVDIHLDAGDYEVRAAPDNHVRVTMTGKTGNATVDVAIAGSHADVTVRDTSHTNFKCVIEVPKV